MADEPEQKNTPSSTPAPNTPAPSSASKATEDPPSSASKATEGTPAWAVDLAAVLAKVNEGLTALTARINAAPAPASPPADPDYQRTHAPGTEGGKGPDYVKGGAETDRKRDAAVAEYQAAHPDASFEQAWDAVRAAKPELFEG
jgi:hypothetical protein